MADIIGIHRFDVNYDEHIVAQLTDGSVTVSKGYTISQAATPSSTTNYALYAYEKGSSLTIAVQQLGDGSLKVNNGIT